MSRFTPRLDIDDALISLPRPSFTIPLSPLSDRIRLADPSQSSIDFDSDQADDDLDDQSIRHPDYDSDKDSDHAAMSDLGPKMRFHSPAPWEEDQDAVPSAQEHPLCFSKRRGIGFGVPSPLLGMTNRPSTESTTSSGRPSKSSDTGSSHSSGSALRSLAQASISNTSLVSSLCPTTANICPKLPLPNLQQETICQPRDQSPIPSLSNEEGHYAHSGFPFASSAEFVNSTDSDARSTWFQSQPSVEVHPYANPKHALRQLVEKADIQSTLNYDTHSDRSMTASRSDSSVTIIESNTFASSASTKVPTDSSLPSFNRDKDTRCHLGPFVGREISAPIPLQRENVPSLAPEAKSPRPHVTNIPGWTERSTSPTFALISLEEARAQHARSVTAQAAMQTPGGISLPTLDPPIRSFDPAPPTPPRGRARSISTGARTKPFKMDRRESEDAAGPSQASISSSAAVPGAKTIKHKKSGFMRIFNGRDKEKGSSLPPVPNLSAAASTPAPRPLMKPAVITTYRVPVPPLTFPTSGERLANRALTTPSTIPNPKKTPPPPIDTSYTKPSTLIQLTECLSAHPRSTPVSISSVPDIGRGLGPNVSATLPPQSAPPSVSDFPSLRLRPISGSFSTQFGHILTSEPEQEELDAISPATARSPITPIALSPVASVSVESAPVEPQQDHSAIIQTLQEQIMSAKKAWQMQIWELEGQVKDLREEIREARAQSNTDTDKEYCATCGRGQKTSNSDAKHSVLHRPRAQTGVSSRFGTTR